MSSGAKYFSAKTKRRDQLQIASNILYSTIECADRKAIRESVGIDGPRLNRYLAALVRYGFVSVENDVYCITDKGLRLLRLLLDLSKIYRGALPRGKYDTGRITLMDAEHYIAMYIGKARSNYDRVYCILGMLYRGYRSKARIQGYCSFNSDQFFKYINMLLEKGLIAMKGGDLVITEKGKIYLRVYEEIIRLFMESSENTGQGKHGVVERA